jgi:carbamoyl-phosphate synthase large subunit
MNTKVETIFKIAVTGCGGGVGQGILKALQDTEYEVIAMDGEALGTGLYTTNKCYIIPYANHKDYITRLLDICKKEKISLLFPGMDAELMILSLNRKYFEEIGTTVVVSTPNVINISDNKLDLYNELAQHGIGIPYTVSGEEFNPVDSNFPIILKQKIGGARSKNVFLIKNLTEWDNLSAKVNNLSEFVAMEYIEGDEYTCGSVNLNNECKGVIVMRRILRDGDTYKCFAENNQLIEDHIRLILKIVKPFGACNVQLRFKNNKPYVFEINARCSGTTASRMLSGFNEPKMIADYLLKHIEPSYTIKYHTILRYWNEIIVENDLVDKLNNELFLINSKPSRL